MPYQWAIEVVILHGQVTNAVSPSMASFVVVVVVIAVLSTILVVQENVTELKTLCALFRCLSEPSMADMSSREDGPPRSQTLWTETWRGSLLLPPPVYTTSMI